ncbi:hypothetical protein TrST_g8988 [Triparma strigata]|uniref:Uncharacterized protein n=1 Tax=Triparma strigata TaxID=1606541 RepID=A0A9W7EUN0_9STRA|nr:hypothetical protein TrST_g8988 [Triparma strigata]
MASWRRSIRVLTAISFLFGFLLLSSFIKNIKNLLEGSSQEGSHFIRKYVETTLKSREEGSGTAEKAAASADLGADVDIDIGIDIDIDRYSQPSPSSLAFDAPKATAQLQQQQPFAPSIELLSTIKFYYADNYNQHRGVNYIYNKHGHLLYVPPYVPDSNTIIVSSASNSTSDSTSDCPNLTLWVRLHGPELITGLATPNQANLATSTCSWSFTFPPPSPGNYTLAVKLQSLNSPSLDINRSLCSKKVNLRYMGTAIKTISSPGTFYSSWEGCCDICTRMPRCNYWTSRDGFKAENRNPRCLFYEEIEGEEEVTGLEGKSKVWSGVRRTEASSVHLGCGWDYEKETEELWCKSNGEDDMPYNLSPTIQFPEPPIQSPNISVLPTCSPSDPRVTYGRWYKTPRASASSDCSPFAVEAPEKGFYRTVHKATENEECWIHDSPKQLGKMCNSPRGCTRSVMSNTWISDVALDDFEYVWKPYGCDLKLYVDEEIKKCWEEKNFGEIEVKGDSVTEFFNYYVQNRFKKLDLKIGRRKITVTNLKLTHLIWHDSFSEFKEKIFDDNLNKGQPHSRLKLENDEIKIWLLGPHIISERESGCTSERMNKFGHMLRPEISERGWKEVDWRNISMGLSHEMATQMDGLHVVGPAMKVAFHLVVHAVCG